MDKKLAEDFDQHLKKVMYSLSEKLNQVIEDPIESQSQKACQILDTKRQLLQICFDKATEYMMQTDEAVAGIYGQIYGNMTELPCHRLHGRRLRHCKGPV